MSRTNYKAQSIFLVYGFVGSLGALAAGILVGIYIGFETIPAAFILFPANLVIALISAGIACLAKSNRTGIITLLAISGGLTALGFAIAIPLTSNSVDGALDMFVCLCIFFAAMTAGQLAAITFFQNRFENRNPVQ